MRTLAAFLGFAAIAAAQIGRGPALPPAGSASVRPTGSSLGRIRLGAADEKIWFGWRIGVPAAAFRHLTFSEAAAKADALIVASIEGFNTQRLSAEIPKNLTWTLAPGEVRAINNRLRDLNLKMPAYHVDAIPADAESRRRMFTFAKAVGVETIIANPDPASLADLDALASEIGVNLAVENRRDPKALMDAMRDRSKRIGVAADLAGWAQNGIKPADGLALVKDRLLAVNLRAPAPGLSDFFLAAFRAEIKPLIVTVDAGSADTFADLSRSIDALEKALQPAMKARVAQVVDSPVGAIRGPDRLKPEMRAQIDAAVPRAAIVAPKKPRKLLVVDLQMYSGHETIPHGNLMLELMAKYTGAFTPTFSNDLNNLKYPKIKEFDAVFLNNVCGMIFPDEDVRAGILRYVRDGGGIGGNHAITFAANDWPEFMDMMGMWAGAHHTETQVLKIDDPASPLASMFDAKGFEHTDEFYHFPASSPYTREKQHVLMSIDVDKSDMATAGKFCAECTRPDQDYAVAWIKSYGKGRIYVTPLGHTPILYTSPQWEKHMLAAVQFMLGDLDADTTPSARLHGARKPGANVR